MADTPWVKDVYGTLGQYRIVVDELKAGKLVTLAEEDYEALLAVSFDLPFQVPWPPNPQSVILSDTFMVFRLRPLKKQVTSPDGLSQTITVTRVTAATPSTRRPPISQKSLSDTFDWMLEFLNDFLLAYALVTKDRNIRPVTLPMLEVHALWGYIRPYDGEASVQGILLINPGAVEYEKPTLPYEIAEHIVRLNLAINSGQYPFSTSWRLRLDGERLLTNGEYATASVVIGSAFEARANELLRYFYWKDGQTEDELIAALNDVGFVTRLKTEYHPRLGGNFDLQRAGPLKHWHRFTHHLRSRVVHGGYTPERSEVEHALAAMILAWDYVMGLVRAKVNSYQELKPFIQLGGERFFWPPSQEHSARGTEGESS
jgi:hypothetical protein